MSPELLNHLKLYESDMSCMHLLPLRCVRKSTTSTLRLGHVGFETTQTSVFTKLWKFTFTHFPAHPLLLQMLSLFVTPCRGLARGRETKKQISVLLFFAVANPDLAVAA